MGVNKWLGIGNLTRDPEIKYTPSGACVCTFSIACNERYKDRDGVKKEKVEYINIVAWRQLAEICGKFLKKGKQIYCEGKITTRSYDDRDGNKRYITEIVIDQMQMLGSKEMGDDRPAQQSGHAERSGTKQQQQSEFDQDTEIPF